MRSFRGSAAAAMTVNVVNAAPLLPRSSHSAWRDENPLLEMKSILAERGECDGISRGRPIIQ